MARMIRHQDVRRRLRQILAANDGEPMEDAEVAANEAPAGPVQTGGDEPALALKAAHALLERQTVIMRGLKLPGLHEQSLVSVVNTLAAMTNDEARMTKEWRIVAAFGLRHLDSSFIRHS